MKSSVQAQLSQRGLTNVVDASEPMDLGFGWRYFSPKAWAASTCADIGLDRLSEIRRQRIIEASQIDQDAKGGERDIWYLARYMHITNGYFVRVKFHDLASKDKW